MPLFVSCRQRMTEAFEKAGGCGHRHAPAIPWRIIAVVPTLDGAVASGIVDAFRGLMSVGAECDQEAVGVPFVNRAHDAGQRLQRAHHVIARHLGSICHRAASQSPGSRPFAVGKAS